MPINFPNSPSPNQQYTYDNKTWEWNGIYWEVYSALTSYVTYTTFNSYTATTQPLILNSLTGGTYSGGTLYLVNNSGGTITITGVSTSSSGGTISGDYLPLSGGTVTGGTIFQSGLTANTISATTYYNLPTDVFVTGGTYSNGNTTFRNNTGGTFTVTGSTIYSSGILSGSSNWVSNGNGSVNLPTVQVALYNNSSYTEPVQVYTVSSGVTGSGGIAALTDNDTNYIYIEYNNGSPRWGVSTDNSFINGSDIDLCYLIYRANNFVHVLDFGNEGAGLPNKISNRIVAVNRFGRESGFSLGLSGATGVVTLTSGVAWNGTNRQSLVAVNSQDDIFFKSFHSGGTWVYTTTGDTINNTYYDDGTDIVLATASKYLVNWYFRGQEINDHLYEVYGTDEYDSVAEAQLSVEPVLPELITSHAFLTGRIIVQVSATTGSVESTFVQVFQSTQVTQHNDLTSIQGGTAGEYYHLTASEYSNNAYTNVDNNFSVGQTISGGLIVDTISATTYYNYPDTYVTGFSLTNDVITLSQNRTDSYSSFTVTLSGLTGTPQQIAYYNVDGVLTGDTNFTRLDETNGYTTTINTVNFSNINEHQDAVYDYSRIRNRVFNDDTSLVGVTNLNSESFISKIENTSDGTISGLEILESSGSFTYQDSGGTYCGFFYNSTNPGWSIVRSGNQYDYNLPQSAYVAGSVLTDVSGDGNLTWVVPTPSTFTGGTVSGSTNFISGLTANTISATTYQNLPATPFLPLSGGTVNGDVNINGVGQRALQVTISNTGTSYGVYSYATRGTNAYGVYGVASADEFPASITNGIGGYFAADDSNGQDPINKYSVQLKDGTEGVGKVLTSVTSDGKANWDTPKTNGSNLYLFYNY
jgi:hypothetical protein